MSVILRLATRAEVEASPMCDRVKERLADLSGGQAKFAREGVPDMRRCVRVEVPSPRAAIWRAVGEGWVYVTGFLISREGHVFHVPR